MPNFGYDVIGGSTDAAQENWSNEAMVGASLRYTASSGDTVTRVEAYGDGDGTCEVGVYTFSGGVPVTRVGTATVTIGTGAAWYGTDVSFALSAGVVYVVAIEYVTLGGGSWNMRYDATGAGTNGNSVSANTGLLPATWSQSSTSAAGISMRAIVTSGAPADAPWMRVPRFHQAGLWMPRGRGRNKRSR